MTTPHREESKLSRKQHLVINARRRAQRAKAHIAKHRVKYSLLTIVSIVWAIASNLLASAIAPWFGLAP